MKLVVRFVLAVVVLSHASLGAAQTSLVDAAKKAKEEHATGMGWPVSANTGGGAAASEAPPAASDANAAAPASTLAGLPDFIAGSIRAQCAVQWPDDFRMRVYCEKQQREGLDKIAGRGEFMKSKPALQAIRLKCLKEWSKLGAMRNGERTLIIDFRMNNSCEEQQLKALGELSR